MILPLGKTRSRLAFDVPNARAKGRGRIKLGEIGKAKPRVPLSGGLGGGLDKEWRLLFALGFLLSGAIRGKPLLRPTELTFNI